MTLKLVLQVPMTARKSVNWILDEHDVPMFSSNKVDQCYEWLTENNHRVFYTVSPTWWTLTVIEPLTPHQRAAIGDVRHRVAPPPPEKDEPPWQR